NPHASPLSRVMTTMLFDWEPFQHFVTSNLTRWFPVRVMPAVSKNDRYILVTLPLKTAEDFSKASAAVAGALQVQACPTSTAISKVATMHDKTRTLASLTGILMSPKHADLATSIS
ncbi:MAG TPA: hypothetical protein VFS12_13725, partial [Terriglobia bacterium]|nr:hypothetical protein [Terriglobia bacterium]